jgi:hypothetical protein
MRALLLVFLAMTTVASASGTAPGRQIIGSEQDHSLAGAAISDCDHFYRTTFTSFRAQTHEQEQRSSRSPASSSSKSRPAKKAASPCAAGIVPTRA